jgi:DNA repair ATPase RecN
MLYCLSEHVFSVGMEEIMDNLSEWTEQLLEAEQQIAEAYNILATLQDDLKAAGRKKDTQAIGEVLERLARYGRLFEDIRQSWTEVLE